MVSQSGHNLSSWTPDLTLHRSQGSTHCRRSWSWHYKHHDPGPKLTVSGGRGTANNFNHCFKARWECWRLIEQLPIRRHQMGRGCSMPNRCRWLPEGFAPDHPCWLSRQRGTHSRGVSQGTGLGGQAPFRRNPQVVDSDSRQDSSILHPSGELLRCTHVPYTDCCQNRNQRRRQTSCLFPFRSWAICKIQLPDYTARSFWPHNWWSPGRIFLALWARRWQYYLRMSLLVT